MRAVAISAATHRARVPHIDAVVKPAREKQMARGAKDGGPHGPLRKGAAIVHELGPRHAVCRRRCQMPYAPYPMRCAGCRVLNALEPTRDAALTLWPLRMCCSWPVRGSQRRTVLSHDADASCEPPICMDVCNEPRRPGTPAARRGVRKPTQGRQRSIAAPFTPFLDRPQRSHLAKS